ncbi:MAG: hypothetical protein AAF919_00465 [Pseudomonadota bacterium]
MDQETPGGTPPDRDKQKADPSHIPSGDSRPKVGLWGLFAFLLVMLAIPVLWADDAPQGEGLVPSTVVESNPTE